MNEDSGDPIHGKLNGTSFLRSNNMSKSMDTKKTSKKEPTKTKKEKKAAKREKKEAKKKQ
jgi:hypothetical protein